MVVVAAISAIEDDDELMRICRRIVETNAGNSGKDEAMELFQQSKIIPKKKTLAEDNISFVNRDYTAPLSISVVNK